MVPRLGWLLLLGAATGAAERCVALKRSGVGDLRGERKREEGIALCEQDPARQQSEQACKAGDPVDNPADPYNPVIDPAIECVWETDDEGPAGLIWGIGIGAFVAASIANQVHRYLKRKRAEQAMGSSPTPPVGAPPAQVAQAVEMTGSADGVPIAQAQVVGVVGGTPT